MSVHQCVLRESEVAFPLGPVVWAEAREEDLSVHFVQELLLALGLGSSSLCSAALLPPFYPQAFLLMVHCSPLDQTRWVLLVGGAPSHPLCTRCPASCWPRAGALGFLTGEMNREHWRNPTEEFNLEELLFNSPYFPIIRTNSLLAQFPFPKVEGIQETSPKMPSPILSLTV